MRRCQRSDTVRLCTELTDMAVMSLMVVVVESNERMVDLLKKLASDTHVRCGAGRGGAGGELESDDGSDDH